LFGENVHSLEDEDSGFATSFNYAQSITAWRFRVPLWRYLVPKRRFLQEIKKLDEFVYKIIDNAIKRREELERNPTSENDEKGGHANLLDHFLAAQQEHDFTRKYLRDMLLNFLLAGRDTVRSSS
jgi:cytochrome P450